MNKPLFSVIKSLFYLIAISCSPFISQAQYYGAEEEAIKPFSIGLTLGSSAIWGEVEPDVLKSYEVGLTFQQVLSRIVDFRFQFRYGQARGLGRSSGDGVLNNTAWNGTCFCEPKPDYVTTSPATPFFNNQTQYFDGAAQVKFNLNRVLFKNASRWDFYVFGGLGVFMYQTSVDALDGNNAIYDFSNIPSNTDQTVSSLRALLDGTFETPAEQDFLSSSAVGNYALLTAFSAGTGFRFRVGDGMAFGIEARFLDTNDYLTDGVQWNDEDKITGRTDKLLSGVLTVDFILKKKSKF